MNKQELIEKYKTKYAEEPKDWRFPSVNASRQALFSNFINDLEQLDEPKKVVVPKFVADWIEYAKKKGVSLIVSFNPWDLYGAEYIEATRWIDNNQETFALAWVNGYEVEKEPFYYVKLPGVGYLNNADGGIKHTEKEIKAIDKRYWPFAVKVEG
ncbi:TPA: DUF1642 domain-containing protein [Enterococcus faecalis]